MSDQSKKRKEKRLQPRFHEVTMYRNSNKFIERGENRARTRDWTEERKGKDRGCNKTRADFVGGTSYLESNVWGK